jgi:hypothetical protein
LWSDLLSFSKQINKTQRQVGDTFAPRDRFVH